MYFPFFNQMRSGIRILLKATLPVGLTAGAAMAQPCVPLTEVTYSDSHRTAIQAIRAQPREPALQRELPRIATVVNDFRRQSGDSALPVLVARLDQARMQSFAKDLQGLAASVQAIFVLERSLKVSTADDKNIAIERLSYAYCLGSVTPSFPLDNRIQYIARAIELHRSAFGVSVKQSGLMMHALKRADAATRAQNFALIDRHAPQHLAFAAQFNLEADAAEVYAVWLDALNRQPNRRQEALALARTATKWLGQVKTKDRSFGYRTIEKAMEIFKASFDIEGYYNVEKVKFALDLSQYSFATDWGGFGWIFVHALRVREREPERFLEVMKNIAVNMKAGNARCGRKDVTLCAFDLGQQLRQSGGGADLAWEYARAAKAYADGNPAIDPEERRQVTQDLAEYERKAGYLGRAARLEEQTESLSSSGEQPFDPYRILERAGPEAAIRDAVDAVARDTNPNGSIRHTAIAFLSPRLNLLYSSDFLLPEQRKLESALLSQVKGSSFDYTAFVLVAGAKVFPNALKREVARAMQDDINRMNGSPLELGKIYPGGGEMYAEAMAAYCIQFSVGCFMQGAHGHKLLGAVLEATDGPRRSAAFKKFADLKIENGIDLGTTGDIGRYLSDVYEAFEFALLLENRTLARLMAEEWFTRCKQYSGAQTTEFHQRRIQEVLSLLAWQADDALRANRPGEAARLLDEAEKLATTRLAREWRSGNTAAARTLAALRPHLRAGAAVRGRLAATASQPDQSRFAAAFNAIQLTQVTDAALAVMAQAQQRLSGNEQARKALADGEDLQAELRRINVLKQWFIAYVTEDDAARARNRLSGRSPAGSGGSEVAAFDKTTTITPLSLNGVRAQLNAGELLITTLVGEEETVVMAVSQSTTKLNYVRISKRSLIDGIQSLTGASDVRNGMLAPFPFDVSADLFDRLFSTLKVDLLGAKQILYVPDGPLLGLPLHMLLTEKVKDPPASISAMRTTKLPWLALGPAISILPNVRAVESLRQMRPSQAQHAFLGVGDPILLGPPGTTRGASTATVLDRSGRVNLAALSKLNALPDTSIELQRMASSLDTSSESLLLQARATEANVKSMPLTSYRIIAFATHGLLAGELDGLVEPALVLTPPSAQSTLDDGVLMASEIASLKLDADLVILSACNTAGSSGRPQAEGLSGLTRAFIAAGARSIVASHWSVPSTSTNALMSEMIRQKSLNPQTGWAVAHRAAMLQLLQGDGPAEFAHPANWAGFVVVGAR